VGDLERDTRLAGADGRYTAELSRDWEIWGPNGGYLAAIALRAAGAVATIRRPASYAGQFLRVAEFGKVDVEVSVPRAGRRSEALRVSIQQGGEPVLEALVRTAAEVPGLEHDVVVAPEAAPPDALPVAFSDEPPRFHFWNNFDTRWVTPLEHERSYEDPRPPLSLSWHRFQPRALFDDPFLDAGRALLLIDTMTWPAAALPHPNGEFIAPNLDVAAWFHRSALESEWLLVEHTSPVAEAGLMGTAGRIFDSARRLVASGGAQLFCVPRPPED
jgi:acyl-CoA thioesterase